MSYYIKTIFDLKHEVYEAIKKLGPSFETKLNDIPVEFVWRDKCMYLIEKYDGKQPTIVWSFSDKKPGEPNYLGQIMSWVRTPTNGTYEFFITPDGGPYRTVKSVEATYDGDSIIIELIDFYLD